MDLGSARSSARLPCDSVALRYTIQRGYGHLIIDQKGYRTAAKVAAIASLSQPRLHTIELSTRLARGFQKS